MTVTRHMWVKRIGNCKYQNIRISEHYNCIKKNTSSQSIIREHRTHYNHEFRWNEKYNIGLREKMFNKRLISKMLHIKQHNGLNLQTEK